MKKEEKKLSSLNFLQRIYRFDELDSTNMEAKRLLKEKEIILPSIIIAKSQGKGYGRFKRDWFSPKEGLYFSLVLRREFSPEGLPLFVGICIAKAFRNFSGVEIKLKWPNDLVYKKKKIAGILTEIVNEKVIIGCGVNTFDDSVLKEMGVSNAINYPLPDEGREKLLYEIVRVFSEEIPVFHQRGFSPFKDEWKEFSYCLGKTIEFSTPDGSLEGKVKDITSNGGIIIQAGEEISVFYSGEVSIKRIYGKN
ncbi:biotin--[acetyl-CoA-carboxylase] ligase [bacterium]|nr:biotin--[acetyl-CoA-carboxylase] ligase [bacterium]